MVVWFLLLLLVCVHGFGCRGDPQENERFSQGSKDSNYPNNLKVQYVLTAPVGKFVHLKFVRFAMEKNYDFVYIYSPQKFANGTVNPSKFTKVASLTGHTLPPNFVSTTNIMLLEFASDAIQSDDGFEAYWVAADTSTVNCPPLSQHSVDSTERVNITSQLGPSYIANVNCSWVIKAKPSLNWNVTLHTIVFTKFSINSDSLVFRDGLNGPVLLTIRGNSLPPVVVLRSQALHIDFKPAVAYFGFEMSLQVSQFACPSNCSESIGGGMCDKARGICKCNDGWYGGDCSSSECFGSNVRQEKKGILSSSNDIGAKSKYQPYTACTTTLLPPPNTNSLLLHFLWLDLNVRDYVAIFLLSGNNSTVVRVLTGSVAPEPFLVNATANQSVKVDFSAAASALRPGFKVNFTWQAPDPGADENGGCPNDCGGGPAYGRCRYGTCLCAPKYTGPDCSAIRQNFQWLPVVYRSGTQVGGFHGRLEAVRGNSSTAYYLGGYRGTNSVPLKYGNFTTRFDLATGRWQPVATQLQPDHRRGTHTVVVGRLVFMFGGKRLVAPQDILNDGWLFDTVTEVWAPVSINTSSTANEPVQRRMQGGMCAFADGRVVAAMGNSQHVTVFDFRAVVAANAAGSEAGWKLPTSIMASERAQDPAKPPGLRKYLTLGCMGEDSVVMFGGITSASQLDSRLWVYSMSANTWVLKQPIGQVPLAMFGQGHLQDANRLLFFGGDTSINPVTDTVSELTYEPKADTYRFRILLDGAFKFSPRIGTAVTKVGDALLLVGGRESASDPLSDTWMMWSRPASPVHSSLKFASNCSRSNSTTTTNATSTNSRSNSSPCTLSGEPILVTLETRDENGFPRFEGNDKVEGFIEAANTPGRTFAQVTDHLDGTYTLTFSNTLSGTLQLTVRLNGQLLTTMQEEQRQLQVGAAVPNVAKLVVSGSALKGGVVTSNPLIPGAPSHSIVVHTYDTFGNRLERGGFGGKLSVKIQTLDKSTTYHLEVQDNGDGSYTMPVNLSDPNDYMVEATYEGASLPGSPFKVKFELPEQVTTTVQVVVVLLSVVTILMCLITFVVLFKHRSTPIVRASSFTFSSLILLGLAVACTFSAIRISPVNTSACFTYPWLLMLTVCLVIAPILTKTWRINQLFNSNMKKLMGMRTITDTKLLSRLLVLILIEAGFLLVWQLLYPPFLGMIIIENKGYYKCMTSDESADSKFETVSTIGNFLLIAFTTYQAFCIRKVPSLFNESRYIAVVIYNGFVVFGFVWLLHSVLPQDAIPLYSSVVTLSVVFLALTVLLVLFGPKVFTIIWRPHENVIARKATMSSSTSNISNTGSFRVPAVKVLRLEDAIPSEISFEASALSKKMQAALKENALDLAKDYVFQLQQLLFKVEYEGEKGPPSVGMTALGNNKSTSNMGTVQELSKASASQSQLGIQNREI